MYIHYVHYDSIASYPPEPSAPRDVTVATISATTVSISWQPPDPPNGILLDYELLVQASSSGAEVVRLLVPITEEEQGMAHSRNVTGLSLEEEVYTVTVSARTSAGRGPESAPVIARAGGAAGWRVSPCLIRVSILG